MNDHNSFFGGAQAADSDLDALAALSTTGVVVRTGAGTATTRTIAGTGTMVVVTNGDGVAGAPKIDAGADLYRAKTLQLLGW